MSISQRDRRVLIYAYSDAGAGDGFVRGTYTQQASSSPDGAWWGSFAAPTGREAPVAGQSEHTVSAVIGLSALAPVAPNSLLTIEGVTYRVLAILERRPGVRQVECLCESVDESAYPLVSA